MQNDFLCISNYYFIHDEKKNGLKSMNLQKKSSIHKKQLYLVCTKRKWTED